MLAAHKLLERKFLEMHQKKSKIFKRSVFVVRIDKGEKFTEKI